MKRNFVFPPLGTKVVVIVNFDDKSFIDETII